MLGVAPRVSRYRTNKGATKPPPAARSVLHRITEAGFFLTVFIVF